MDIEYKAALLKTSLNDYPGRIASVIFFPACNLRCPWCHNGALVLGKMKDELVPLKTILQIIGSRAHLISAVVLSGGEPALFEGLPELIVRIKEMGLLVKLDTNGTRPNVLKKLLDGTARPDFIAMDLKFNPERYGALEVSPSSAPLGEAVRESARLIRESSEKTGMDYEFRSLVFPSSAPLVFDEQDIEALRGLAGSGRWRLRRFRGGNCLDPRWDSLPPVPPSEFERLSASLGQ
ncbi:MAG: anaerobic ribonucleoside-triphosphate reductase activating protein [Spirochaetaceae bacterium]|jgi:pyruvate formate lyase activating enzyme|nr:anaerobic ribonucleoside-triphosphate reductase activating protein [Spirochaetaceae bacterium]